MKNIAIFASGSGSNAQKIMEHFAASPLARVALVVTCNPHAGVLIRAHAAGVPTLVVDRADFKEGGNPLAAMKEHHIDYIVLAGFLQLVPALLIEAYPGRIINIHPALLPRYGGKGMYGSHVHRAVIAAREKESGITIHTVDERYDEGGILAQYRVTVDPGDTPDMLAEKIHVLEHAHFSQVIENEIAKL